MFSSFKLNSPQKDGFKYYLTEFLLVNCFIINLLAATISSYKASSIFIKIISSAVMWGLIFFNYKLNGPEISSQLKSKSFRNLIFAVLSLILIPAATLTYSGNPAYGGFKILSMATGTIPVIFAFYYLLITLTETRIKIFFYSAVIEISILVLLVLTIQPFYYDGQHIITLARWSHVITGHFVGPAFFLFFFMIIKSETKNKLLFFTAGSVIAFTAVYISGLRAGLTGVIIFSLFTLLTGLVRKELTAGKLMFIFSAAIVSILILYFLHPYTEIVRARYYSLTDLSKPEVGDASITARVTGLEVAYDIFKNNPFAGAGFGGYKNYNNIPITDMINYPHNIFVEFLIELGVPGLLYFILLLFIIFNSARKASLYITIFFCFALWLALFSKSISSNALLWIGLGFWGVKMNDKREKIKTG